MAKIYKQYTITGTSFPETFYQLQSDAEFRLAKEDPDGDEILPYLIEVSVGENERVRVWTEGVPVSAGEVQWSITLLVFESDLDKLCYISNKHADNAIRRSKIKIDFNPLVNEKKK